MGGIRREPSPIAAGTRSDGQPDGRATGAATDCPRLRRLRELLAEEDAAKFDHVQAQRQAAAIDRWRIVSSGEGNQAFFQLSVDLRAAGMTLTEIDSILRQEAGYGRHPAERRAQIGSIIRTLAGSSRRLAA